MFFAKDEVIELEDKKKYLVLDTAIVENEVFYQIQEVDETNDSLTGPKTIICATNDEGSLYIDDVVDSDKINRLNEIFVS